MIKRIINVLLASLFLLGLSSCKDIKESANILKNRQRLNIGIVISENENDISKINHTESLKKVCKDAKLRDRQLHIAEDVSEENIREVIAGLAQNGSNLIFVVGDGLDDYVIQSAKNYPETGFCYAGGSNTDFSSYGNIHRYVFDTSQARYISGVIAGYKILDLIECEIIPEEEVKVGFVASFPDARAISAYTAFYLGIKSVYSDTVLQVYYTKSEENAETESLAAKALIANGCVMISQQSAMNSSAKVCRENGVCFIGTENSASETASDCYITSVTSDYISAYREIIGMAIEGKEIPAVARGKCTEETSATTEINKDSFIDYTMFEKVLNEVKDTKIRFEKDELHVFDCSKWKVNGQQIKTTATESLTDDFNGTEFISKDGYFLEYENSSLPVFAFIIDGITEINAGR